MKIKRIKVYQAVPFEGRPHNVLNTFQTPDNSDPVVSMKEDELGVLAWSAKCAIRIGWPNISVIEYDIDSFNAEMFPKKSEKKA